MTSNSKPRVRITSDGLVNVASGLGGDRDKRSYNSFQLSSFWDWPQLQAAYQESWLARAVVDYPVEDATREWREINTEKAEEIEREEKRLRVPTIIQDGFCSSRLYGGSIIVMVTNQPLDEPLEVDRIGKGDLKRLLVVDRNYVSGFEYNYTEPMRANYLLPEWYTIYGGQARIHHSHIIRVPGERLPMSLRVMNAGWGDSVLRKCMEDIKDATATKAGIAGLVQEANVDIVRRAGLGADLSSGQDEAIMTRYRMFGLMKSNVHLGLLDADTEEYERHAASFSGLGDVLNGQMEWMSGASGIPVSRLYGKQVGGLSDTGEGDSRNYHNKIRSLQDGQMREVMEQLDEVLVRSAIGDYPEDYDFQWAPLSQPDGNEIAQQELAFSQADSVRLEQGTVTLSEIMRLRKDDYGISDDRIKRQVRIEDIESPDFDGEEIGGDVSGEGFDPNAVDPDDALNGAQVTAMLEVLARVREGSLTASTASKVITASFPLTPEQAESLVSEIEVDTNASKEEQPGSVEGSEPAGVQGQGEEGEAGQGEQQE